MVLQQPHDRVHVAGRLQRDLVGRARLSANSRSATSDGVCDREIDELASGLFVGEVAFGLDRFAQLAVERFDRVGGRYSSVVLMAMIQVIASDAVLAAVASVTASPAG